MPPTSPNAGPARRSTSSRVIPTGNLNSRAFAPFGQVIQNPATHGGQPEQLAKTTANQGTATKWLDVTHLDNWYLLAPSKKPSRAVMNMFVCSPRQLETREPDGRLVFPIHILERHPYTPQTFIPLGVPAPTEDSGNNDETRYLVIVAPTLQTTSAASPRERPKAYPAEQPKRSRKSLRERLLGARPTLYSNEFKATTTPPSDASANAERKPKGPGEPDLDNLQAFIARGDQAVTYGPGTWHAPMVVLGRKDVDFVVVQHANGVGLEDCQEFDVHDDIAVDVGSGVVEASAPGIMRAKL